MATYSIVCIYYIIQHGSWEPQCIHGSHLWRPGGRRVIYMATHTYNYAKSEHSPNSACTEGFWRFFYRGWWGHGEGLEDSFLPLFTVLGVGVCVRHVATSYAKRSRFLLKNTTTNQTL